MVIVVFSKNGLSVWEEWGGKAGPIPDPIFHMREGELALVLEDCLDRGGNGSRIVTTDGRSGWVNVNYISRV